MSNLMYTEKLMETFTISTMSTTVVVLLVYWLEQFVPVSKPMSAIVLMLLSIGISIVLNFLFPCLIRYFVVREDPIFPRQLVAGAAWRGRAIGIVVGAWVGVVIMMMFE
ncbi:hypothetical protein WJ62_22285 [Burkholderia diffusa]|nr:hypothetical protein WJ62_22285 [Burkholderia diffusa]